MSVASELLEQFKSEEQSAAAEASVENSQPVETAEPAVESQTEPEKPAEEKPEPAEEPKAEEAAEPEKPAEEPKAEPKPDLSKLTKEEKANHAFQRQLAKQREKHALEIDELKKTFQSQFDELKKSLTPKPEPEPMKTRDEFNNDTDFVNYLAMRGVDQRLAEKAEADAKAKAEADAKAKEEAEMEQYKNDLLDNFDKNAKAVFGDGSEAWTEFNKKLAIANENDLGSVLREAPAVRDFIFTNPDGPILLNEILNSKNAFVRVFSRSNNPEDARWVCNAIAYEARNKAKVADDQPAVAPKVMPNLGKPGSGSAPSTAPDMWKDDKSLIDFVRRHR